MVFDPPCEICFQMSSLTRAAALLALGLLGCYGRATPDSCHRKYVVNGRGDDTRDNYAACMLRASALEHGVEPDVEALRERVAFETGCVATTVKVFEHQGNAATIVGADACGQRLTYTRRLRHRLGTRTARGSEWVLVTAASGSSPATSQAAHELAPADRVFGKSAGSL